MSSKSKIEWTDTTWNPVTGCSKVSPGCKNCYAERDWARLSAPRKKPNIYTGRKFTDVQCHEKRLDQPLRWRKPRRIFVNSMSDLFHEDVPDEFIHQIFAVMVLAPHHIFQVLTKRPERMLEYLRSIQDDIKDTHLWVDEAGGITGSPCAAAAAENRNWPLSNIWLGVSIEDQETADERIPLLLQTPAAVRWLSIEPLLGPINIIDTVNQYDRERCGLQDDPLAAALLNQGIRDGNAFAIGPIDWVVVGGESGPKARPMHPAWVRSLRDHCQVASVPFFFKQWGEWGLDIPKPFYRVSRNKYSHESITFVPDGDIYNPTEPDTLNNPLMKTMYRVGKKNAGRTLNGRTWDEYPAAVIS